MDALGEASSGAACGAPFAFSDLKSEEVQVLYGIDSNGLDEEYSSPVARGNYIATSVQAELRRQGYRQRRCDVGLAALLDFPLELILEVFARLHPLDLYNMMCTTRYLRSLLLDKGAASVIWATAFRCYPDILPCPADVSPPRWATLLFGPAICDVCSRRRAMPDFTYRRRFCQQCLDKLCQAKDDIKDTIGLLDSYPDEEGVLFGLVRYTYKTKSMQYPDVYAYFREPRYLIEDVRRKAAEMEPYLQAISSGALGARSKYTTFSVQSRKDNLRFLKHVKTCNEWCLDIHDNLHNACAKRVISFSRMAGSTLIKLGHDSRDIDFMRLHSYFSNHFLHAKRIRFSKKEVWKNLPALVNFIELARQSRLQRERLERITSLRRRLSSFYKSIVQTSLAPELWDYVPDDGLYSTIPQVVRYVQAEYKTEDDLPDLSTTDIGPVLLDFVNTWIAKKRQHLINILQSSRPVSFLQGGNENVDILSRATAVFTHPPLNCNEEFKDYHSLLIGWEEAGVHTSCEVEVRHGDQDPTTIGNCFKFSQAAYDTIALVLRLIGLDPNTALARDVDALNKRFVCMKCPPLSEHGVNGSYVMDWRECARHSVSSEGDGHRSPCFAMLTDEATASVLFHETDSYLTPSGARWSCKHCPEHFDSPVSKKQAMMHISQRHHVRNPVEGTDYLRRRKNTARPRKLYFLRRDDGSNLRCLLCQGHSRLRLWSSEALNVHLNKRHKLTTSDENVHWESLQIIDRTTIN